MIMCVGEMSLEEGLEGGGITPDIQNLRWATYGCVFLRMPVIRS